MTRFCVKKPYTVVVGVIMVLVLGVISFLKVTTDLLPSITLPYIIAVTTYPGASPEKVESTVTTVLESGLGTVNGVENVTSTSSENYSMVMLEFSDGTNMDSAMVKLSTAVDQLTDALPEEVGKPMLMELSPDMLPTMTFSVDMDGKDAKELGKFVKENVVPYLERQDGVASVNKTGLVEETVEIKLNDQKITKINDRLLASMNDQFADALSEMENAEGKLDSAAAQIKSGQSSLQSKQEETYGQLADSAQKLDEAMATAAAYQTEVSGLKTSQAALTAEKNAYEQTVKPGYDQINEMLGQLSEGMGGAYSISSILADDSKQQFQMVQGMLQMMAQAQPDNTQIQALIQNFTWENLSLMEEKMTVRLPQIETELSNLQTEIAAAEAVLAQVNQQMEQAKAGYAELEKGKMAAASGFGAAAAQLAAGQTEIDNAMKEMDDARTQYETAREEALKQANIDALVDKSALSGILYAQNFEMPAGYIKEGDSTYLLKIGDQIDKMEDLKKLLLCKMEGIGEIRLEDVADIGITDNSEDSFAHVNGNGAVVLSCMKSSSAGTSDVSKVLNQAIKQLEEENNGLHITVFLDQGDYIKIIIKSVMQNLIWGAILAIFVLALFLKDFKPTIVVAFSIPMSVLFALVLMFFSNVTLNIISLSGLALGIGMLVDNSIVVIENIYRLRNMGISAPRAAVLGAKQVAGAIFASTLTTICVFLPIVFTDGLTRELFTDMGLTIAYSLLASLIVALTFVPTMSATVLQNCREKKHPLFDRVMLRYETALRFCLKVKVVPLGIAVVLLVISVVGAASMGLELIPAMNSDVITATINVQEEFAQDEIYTMIESITDQVQKMDGVETVGAMSNGGNSVLASFGSQSTGKQTAFTVYAMLDEKHRNDGEKISKEIMELSDPDKMEITATSSGMDTSALGGSGVEVRIEGEDLDEMLSVSEQVMDFVKQVDGLDEVSNGQEAGEKAIHLLIDKDAAMGYGLTVAQIFSELSGKLTTEKSAADMQLDGETYRVVIVDETDLLTRENILDYAFETTTRDKEGKEVKEHHNLGEFAEVEDAASVSGITRENQARYMTVTATTKDGYNTSKLGKEVQKKLSKYQAPEGITIEMAGEVVNIKETMIDLIKMILLAIAFIYLIMVAQFQSLLSPFIVLFTIPLAFTGGFLALIISGKNLSMTGMIGLLVLAGVVVNNGIVFVDYVNQLRIAGREKKEALVETGKARMRPILMTALTTILAMSTMAFSQEVTAEMSKGMALVTIGGLAYATLMTLFIVPVLYDIFFRRELKVIDVEEEVEMTGDSIVEMIEQK